MRKVEDALKIVMSEAKALSFERIAITEADGRVLAEEITSPIFHPPSDNSAMDGFSVRWEDVEDASKDKPVTLNVVENIPAGKLSDVSLKSGEATSIMTGASIPSGADTVIRVEDTNRSRGETIQIYSGGKKGQDIRLRGENIKKGDKIYDAGTVIGPAEVGMFALMGKPMVSVYRKPNVAILVTGDEIRDLDEEVDENKITNSNGYTLAAQVKEAGGIPHLLGIARDTKEALKVKLTQAFEADVVLTSGGVSMGYHDYVKEVLQELGVEIKFWRVDMRPGHPLAFGMLGEKPVFGLPGNPVSTMVSFEQFARPRIRVMGGHKLAYRPVVSAVLTEGMTNKKGRKHFVRGQIRFEEGKYLASSTGTQGSGVLLSMSKANCLIILPDEGGEFPAGTNVKVQLLGRQEMGQAEPGY
ncbi:MAG: molybdopterin molybdotransferase MoeA [Proteobacteria bacterium]|nr:molybdopterin molybdotransferase MoeA [Pseudomonadota bacterium]